MNTTLANYPALRTVLSQFHGRTVRANVPVPVIWSARFTIAEHLVAALPNPRWFATVNRVVDLDRMFLSRAHARCLASILFDWECPL